MELNPRQMDVVYNFPSKFLWGTATSSYQNEGHNTNSNWSAWENTPGKIINDQKSGAACDWWSGKWKDDFDRAEATHQNAHRLSIEWSRVQPREDHWDESTIEHYRQMLRGLRDRGMEPLVTLHHFSDPLWLSEMGGWENEKTPGYFGAFVNKIVEALKDYCNLWVTINEPNVYAVMGYIEGVFPPGKNDLKAAFSVMANLVKGHAIAYEAIHHLQNNAQVGVATNYRQFTPAKSWNPADNMLANILNQNFNYAFNNAISHGLLRFGFRSIRTIAARNTQDFIGVNYYTADEIQFNPLGYKSLFYQPSFPLDSEISETKFIANVPAGMTTAIHWARKFNKPIYITESGVEDSKDQMRPAYILEHLQKIWIATNYTVPIKGFFHWTLVDNFEWERGWTQRFGLWGLDPASQIRFRRKSVELYAEICRTNSISSAMVHTYAPHAIERMFPG